MPERVDDGPEEASRFLGTREYHPNLPGCNLPIIMGLAMVEYPVLTAIWTKLTVELGSWHRWSEVAAVGVYGVCRWSQGKIRERFGHEPSGKVTQAMEVAGDVALVTALYGGARELVGNALAHGVVGALDMLAQVSDSSFIAEVSDQSSGLTPEEWLVSLWAVAGSWFVANHIEELRGVAGGLKSGVRNVVAVIESMR